MIKNGFYEKATYKSSPNKGGRIKPTLIIVHDTAGSLSKGSSVGWLTNPQAKASAHFVIERDGTVTQLVSTDVKAWHAGVSSYKGRSNVNAFSIGIEFVNPGALAEQGSKSARAYFGTVYDRKRFSIEEQDAQYAEIDGQRISTHPQALWMPYTTEQITAGLDLCLAIKDAYGITAVAPHWFISPRRKIDTNPLFPLGWLAGRLAGRADIVERKPEPLKLDVEEFTKDAASGFASGIKGRKAVLNSNGLVRRWPSFNEENILFAGGSFDLAEDSVAMFFVEGANMPIDMANIEMPWYKVVLDDGTFGWVLQSGVEKIV